MYSTFRVAGSLNKKYYDSCQNSNRQRALHFRDARMTTSAQDDIIFNGFQRRKIMHIPKCRTTEASLYQLYELSKIMRACVSPASIRIHVSGPTLGFGDLNTTLRTPWPQPVPLYPPYLHICATISRGSESAHTTRSINSPRVLVEAEDHVLGRLALAPLVAMV